MSQFHLKSHWVDSSNQLKFHSANDPFPFGGDCFLKGIVVGFLYFVDFFYSAGGSTGVAAAPLSCQKKPPAAAAIALKIAAATAMQMSL